MDVVASFFDTGFRNNECCFWGVAGQLDIENLKSMLREAGLDVDKFVENRQLIFSECNECYIAGKDSVSDIDIMKWEEMYNIAIAEGFNGLRIIDKFTIVSEDSWERFVEYEKKAMDFVRTKKITALFAFLLEARTRSEMLELIGIHDGTIIEKDGQWTLLQSSSSCRTVSMDHYFRDEVLENVWTGVWAVDRNDNIVYFNKGMESISGLSKRDVFEKKLQSFMPKSTNGEDIGFVDVFDLVKEDLRSRSYDVFPFIKPDGQFIYHSGFLLPLTDKEGSYSGMIGTVGKVVEQRIDHKTLRDKFRSIEKLEDIYRESPVVAFLWNAENNWPVVFVSDNISQFGYTSECMTSGKINYGDIVHPDDLDYVQSDIAELEIQGKMFFSKEYRIMTKSGDVRWVTERSHLIRDETGSPAYYQGIIIDITDRKKAEEAGLEAEKKYHMIFEHSPLGIFHFNEKGILTHCNKKFLDIMKLKRKEDVIGFNLIASIVDEQMKKAVSDVFERKVGHFEGDYHTVTTDVTISIKADYSPNIAEDGTFLGGIGIFEDISERKKAEEKLQKSEALLAEVSMMAKIGGWEFDASTGKGTWTPEIARIHELDPSTPTDVELGLSFYTSGSRELIEKAVNDAVQKGEPYDLELELVTAKGTHKWVRTIGNPIIKDGKVVNVTGALQDITERKKAERATVEAEKKYRMIFENSPLGIFNFDKDGIVRHCNRKFLEIMGMQKYEDAIGFNMLTLVQDEQMKKAVNDVLSRKVGHFEGEYHTVRTNKDLNLKADFSPNISEDGTFLGGIGIFEDISARKKAEEAVLEAEKKYRLIFENSPLGIFHFNSRGIVTHCNDKFLEIIGLDNKDQIIGFDMVSRIKDEQMKTAINDVLSRKMGHYEGRYHTVISGKDLYLKADYSPNFASDGTLLGGIGIFGDISVRKKAEEALRLDESRLEALLKITHFTDLSLRSVADFVQEEAVRLTQSKIGYLAFLNESGTMLTMYSWSKSIMDECKVKGKKLEYTIEETGLWGEPIRQKKAIIVNDFDAPNPLKHGYPKGHIRLRRYMSIPIFDGKKIVGVAGVGNKEEAYNKSDVRQLTLFMEGMWRLIQRQKSEDTLREYATELSKVNEELSKTNEELSQVNEELKSLDRMKDDFLSNVSHEFKTPLTSIQGYSQLISDGTLGEVNEQQKKAVETVLRNSERLRRLVDSLLYLSRAQSGKLNYSFELLGIEDIIEHSVQDLALQAESKNIELVTDIPPGLPELTLDRDKMMDVFVNLIDNAVKFTPDGGSVTISAHVSEGSIYLDVKDTGIGIAEDKIPMLFQRFYQVDSSVKRRYGGTGLGLYICKKIIEDHNGNIYVSSEEGKGTTIHIRLPLQQ